VNICKTILQNGHRRNAGMPAGKNGATADNGTQAGHTRSNNRKPTRDDDGKNGSPHEFHES
jgi:hypothetical protein